jgi:AraC family transcriptional regulator
MSEQPLTRVEFVPNDVVRRQSAGWRGLGVEIIQAVEHKRFEYGFQGSQHLLIATERAERRDGETVIHGHLRSARREFSRKLTFVPAGCQFRGWQAPRVLTRTTYFYIDPQGPLVAPELRFAEIDLEPRLFFEDSHLWETTCKLKAVAEVGSAGDTFYAEALSIVLAHELLRLNTGVAVKQPAVRGGLASWQQKLVAEYIDAHMAEPISLADLARTVRLSPFHFARAFKISFGMPPHRYHMRRRIEQAKAMLAMPDTSVTEIGVRVGFSDTSAFTAAFRRLTGLAPSVYRRTTG